METITTPFTLGDPQVAGPLGVFPIFGPDSVVDYRSFAEATALGAFVKELDEGASVNDLLVENPTEKSLLIFEGEEVLGAKQNRAFDASVLVAAGVRLSVPVSCLEQGRWDPQREHEHFRVAPQASDPSLRRLKRARANVCAEAGVAARPDQGEVWDEVGERLARHSVASDSAALDDVYKARRGHLDELAGAIRHVDGQVGAIIFVGPGPVALDLVGRVEVFASLLPRLAQGYALDALGAEECDPNRNTASTLLADSLVAPRTDLATPGLGRGFALRDSRFTGSGLEHQGELVQLSAFPGGDAVHQSHNAGEARIARPSRRRRVA